METQQDTRFGGMAIDIDHNLLMRQFEIGSEKKRMVREILSEARRDQEQFLADRSLDEKKVDAKLGRILDDTEGAQTVADLLDRAIRIDDDSLALNEFVSVLQKKGIPTMFSPMERMLLTILLNTAKRLPAKFVMAQIRSRIVKDTDGKVLIGNDTQSMLGPIKDLIEEGFGVNSVVVGEMVLSAADVEKKKKDIIKQIRRKGTTCISVKISNLDPHINSLDFEGSVERVCRHMRDIMREAKNKGVLVNLDMEEYRDLGITVEVVKRISSDPEFVHMPIGVALQAYIPDSYLVQQDLVEFARERVDKGGSKLRTRIVKGANMPMEDIHASKNGFVDPVYQSKEETDANWKRMVEFGLRPENLRVCGLGAASHNMLELKWLEKQLQKRHIKKGIVDVEMLNGMVQSNARRIKKRVGSVLLYVCEVLKLADFSDAGPYLGRRLSEQTDKNGFLANRLASIDSPEWKAMEAAFIKSYLLIDKVSSAPRDLQNRLTDEYMSFVFKTLESFRNSPNTNFALPANRVWAEEKIIRPIARGEVNEQVPAEINGVKLEGLKRVEVKSKTSGQSKVGEVDLLDRTGINMLMEDVDTDREEGWGSTTLEQRAEILADVAANVERHRADFIRLALVETGKTASQSDPEVSEAVDFAHINSLGVRYFAGLKGVKAKPLNGGRILVAGPWNFPLAIPANGVFASLMAGNKVVLKPAPEARLVANTFVRACYEAGVPRTALFLANCDDDDAAYLGSKFDHIVLTGASETAENIIKAKPSVNLMAETGGKNATIVTHKADYDLAIKSIINAFYHAGQKCSATSRVIITKEVAKDPVFIEKLVAATKSLKVGLPEQLDTAVTTLIHEPTGHTLRGLTELSEGEEFLLKPEQQQGRSDLWSPGIVVGTKPGSYADQTEFFAPVIHVLVAENKDHAIEIANGNKYGLTAGIQTLDLDEAEYLRTRLQAGVIYVNQPTEGAVVKRTPFGGLKKSRYGMGVQAGNENYVLNFMEFEDELVNLDVAESVEFDKDEFRANLWARLKGKRVHKKSELQDNAFKAMQSYLEWYAKYFSKIKNPVNNVVGEEYGHEHVPLGNVVIRFDNGDSAESVLKACMAAIVAGNELELSIDTSISDADLNLINDTLNELGLEAKIRFVKEDQESFCGKISSRKNLGLIKFCSGSLPKYFESVRVANPSLQISTRNVVSHGRIEMHTYMQERSYGVAYHRYGANLRDKDKT